MYVTCSKLCYCIHSNTCTSQCQLLSLEMQPTLILACAEHPSMQRSEAPNDLPKNQRPVVHRHAHGVCLEVLPGSPWSTGKRFASTVRQWYGALQTMKHRWCLRKTCLVAILASTVCHWFWIVKTQPSQLRSYPNGFRCQHDSAMYNVNKSSRNKNLNILYVATTFSWFTLGVRLHDS